LKSQLKNAICYDFIEFERLIKLPQYREYFSLRSAYINRGKNIMHIVKFILKKDMHTCLDIFLEHYPDGGLLSLLVVNIPYISNSITLNIILKFIGTFSVCSPHLASM
jgi:hypothetical protein